MVRCDATVLMNPRPCWHKLTWTAGFVHESPRYATNLRQRCFDNSLAFPPMYSKRYDVYLTQ